jgi:hypothetical protein
MHLVATYHLDAEAVKLSDRAQLVIRLRILSFVSRLWLQLCQKELFSRFTLDSSGVDAEDRMQLVRFVFLITHPLLAAYVTNLRIIDNYTSMHAKFIMERVHEVFPNTAKFIMERVHEVFPNTTCLTINDNTADYRFDSGVITYLVGGFLRIHYLELHWDAFSHEKFQPDSLSVLDNVQLRSVHLSGGVGLVRSWLEVFARSPTLRILHSCTLESPLASCDEWAEINHVWTRFGGCTRLRVVYGALIEAEPDRGTSHLR